MKKLDLRTLQTIYLYADGHAVLVHEKSDKQAGKVQWVEIYEKFGPRCYFPSGRIIFSGFYSFSAGLANLVHRAESVEAKAASVESGSLNTQSKGIPVGHCTIKGKDYSVSLMDLPGLISGEYIYQPETSEKWEDVKDKYSWSYHHIAKKHLAEKVEG